MIVKPNDLCITDFVAYSGEYYKLHKRILIKLCKLLGLPEELWLAFMHFDFDTFFDEEDLRLKSYGKIQGKHALVFQSLYSEVFPGVNTPYLLLEFMKMVSACKLQYGARSVTGVAPFLRYRRADKSTPEYNHEIQSLRILLHWLKFGCGMDALVTCQAHSDEPRKISEEFGLHYFNADPAPAFAKALAKEYGEITPDRFVVDCPDEGSVHRAVSFARITGLPIYFGLKDRRNDRNIHLTTNGDKIAEYLEMFSQQYPDIKFVTEVTNKIHCMYEDEVASGGTAMGRAKTLLRFGAAGVLLLATHGVLTPGWRRKLIDPKVFLKIFLGNTIPRPYRKSTGGVIIDVNVAKPLAEQVKNAMHAVAVTA